MEYFKHDPTYPYDTNFCASGSVHFCNYMCPATIFAKAVYSIRYPNTRYQTANVVILLAVNY